MSAETELSAEHIQQAILAAPPRAPAPDKETTQRILKHTAHLFELDPDCILGPDRKRSVCEARHVALTLIRAHTSLSWPEMGRLFNHRDQHTVIHAVRTVLDTPMRLSWCHAVEVSMKEET